MHRHLLSLVLIAVTGSAAANAILETSGAQRDAWDIIDFTGDASITVVGDATTPPGYGPEVLAVSGDHVLALAKTAARRDGTYTILYRELDPEGKDADGILVFGAQYGDDISTAHNTKQRLPHAWLEQDNDSGLHIRSVGDNGDETIVTHAPGVGLVDEPWNITGWIWQQVQIDGDTLRAKYWPAHTPEPETWNLETQWPEMKAGRVGFRIGSGDIHVAHFAVHDTRDPILPPEAWLVPVNERVVSSAGIALNLFLRDGLEETSPATLTLRGPEDLVRELDMMISPPATPGPITLRLTDEPEEKVNQAPLPKLLPTGRFTISIQLPDKDFAAETTIEILKTDELDARIEVVHKKVEGIDYSAWDELTRNGSPIDASMLFGFVPHDGEHRTAGRALLQRALQQRNRGDLDACRKNLDRAERAAEAYRFSGVDWMFGDAEPIATSQVENPPPPSARFFQSSCPKIVTRLGPGNPRTLAAGHTHSLHFAVRNAWGVPPDRELGLHVMLVNPMPHKIVAETVVRADNPEEAWVGDQRIWKVALTLPRPDSADKPAEPIIQDGWHQLRIQWIDLETGHVLLQGTPPRRLQKLQFRDTGIPGWIQPIEDLYVSTEPVFLRSTELVYTGNEARKFTVVMEGTGPNGKLPMVIRDIALDSPGSASLRPENTALLQASLWSDQRLLASFSNKRQELWLAEAPTVTRRPDDELMTQFSVGTSSPGRLSISKDGTQLKEIRVEGGNDTTSFTLKPHIGYYDVEVAYDNGFAHHSRLIATVVETDGTDILVNGEPFLIKGLNVHGLDGQSPARTRAMMKIFRDLGFNMLRGDYPPYWQMDMAVEENLGWSVLAPFSIVSTDELATERYIGPAFTAAREQTRAFVERYRDSAGVFLWNSANEIQGDITDFLINVKPVYEHHDPMKRPVHYANLYGQDRFDGQDAVGVNYYFGPGETPESRHPMILKNIETAKALGKPLFYTEYNAYEGAIHATGVEAMEGLFEWGVEQGMAGGFFYFRFNSERHPGVIDQGYNTHVLLNDALRSAFNDAEVTLAGATEDTVDLHIRNRRRFTLRKVRLTVADNPDAGITLEDFPPETERTITLNRANNLGNGVYLEGVLRFETHHGFHEKVPFTVMQPGE